MAPMDNTAPQPPTALPDAEASSAASGAAPEPRHRASVLTRSALVAAGLSLIVSGGAYAAVQVAGDGSSGQSTLAGAALGGEAEAAPTGQALTVEAPSSSVTMVTEDVTEAHTTVEKETDSLPEGETKVETQGVDGVTRTVYEVTTVDGQEASRTPVSTVVLTQRVDEVVLVGTGKAQSTPAPSTAAPDSGATTSKGEAEPSPQAPSEDSGSSSSSDSGSSSGGSGGASADDSGVWAQLAQCESGGNPSTNTGNGYYGLYQFSLSTWQSVGGTGLPSDASAEEQTMRAQMLQQRAGWGQWPHCAAKLGLL
ncbi:resuscitation-promoting factor [Actinomyces bowdenii]|nr:resuscitation-promoting factor [Actinomyces bowdenii]